jgi:uncharacterized protein
LLYQLSYAGSLFGVAVSKRNAADKKADREINTLAGRRKEHICSRYKFLQQSLRSCKTPPSFKMALLCLEIEVISQCFILIRRSLIAILQLYKCFSCGLLRQTETMIVETIVSTLDKSGAPNFAPMGVVMNRELVVVRPYRNTRTCRNLIASGYAVVNFSDDALAFVQSGLYHAVLPNFPATAVPGAVFQEACSWQEIALVSEAGSEDRAELTCRVAYKGLKKEFYLCRASNAVIEAAILASRHQFLDAELIDQRMIQYQEIVAKTGGDNELKAFQLIQDYIQIRRSDD